VSNVLKLFARNYIDANDQDYSLHLADEIFSSNHHRLLIELFVCADNARIERFVRYVASSSRLDFNERVIRGVVSVIIQTYPHYNVEDSYSLGKLCEAIEGLLHETCRQIPPAPLK
jgi:hypothetical protein